MSNWVTRRGLTEKLTLEQRPKKKEGNKPGRYVWEKDISGKSKGKDAQVEMRWIYWGAEKGLCIFGIVSEGMHYYMKREGQDCTPG